MMDAIRWLGGHSNKVASAIRAFLYMAIALSWTHLTEAQIGAILLFTEAFLGLFVETNTVSKVRVGERIEEKSTEKANARVAEFMSGTGPGIMP